MLARYRGINNKGVLDRPCTNVRLQSNNLPIHLNPLETKPPNYLGLPPFNGKVQMPVSNAQGCKPKFPKHRENRGGWSGENSQGTANCNRNLPNALDPNWPQGKCQTDQLQQRQQAMNCKHWLAKHISLLYTFVLGHKVVGLLWLDNKGIFPWTVGCLSVCLAFAQKRKHYRAGCIIQAKTSYDIL